MTDAIVDESAAWETWVHRMNPKLDRAGIRAAFKAGYVAASTKRHNTEHNPK